MDGIQPGCVGVGVHQGEASQGFSDMAFSAQPAGFAVVGCELKVPLGSDGDGGCFAVVHDAGELEVKRILGWVQVDELDGAVGSVPAEVDGSGDELTVDDVAEVPDFGCRLLREDEGDIKGFGYVMETISGGEVDRNAGVEQEDGTRHLSPRGFGEVDDLG